MGRPMGKKRMERTIPTIHEGQYGVFIIAQFQYCITHRIVSCTYIEKDSKWTLRQISIQLIRSVWAESRTSTLYSSAVYRHDFLPQTDLMYVFGAISQSSILFPIIYLNLWDYRWKSIVKNQKCQLLSLAIWQKFTINQTIIPCSQKAKRSTNHLQLNEFLSGKYMQFFLCKTKIS